MKNAIRISVKKPCSEKFENFTPTAAGGFCDSCQKEVIDFTAMTSDELINHFSNTSGQTCGRFKNSQLKTYEPMMSHNSNRSFVSRGIAVLSFSLLALCALSEVHAQGDVSVNSRINTEINFIMGAPIVIAEIAVEQYTVAGTVIDEENLPLAGVNVVLKGTNEGIMTDIDGKFEFPRQLDVDDVLIFSYIGYNPQEYKVVADASKNMAINITFDLSNISLMGAVEVEGVYESKQNIFQKFIGLFK
ncbi:MAG: carboxypeptidase-like regulatory domain-containing protein [Maribacter sp.]